MIKTTHLSDEPDFNTADKLNALLIKALVSTGELNEVETYDVDFDHQFLETEKYDANTDIQEVPRLQTWRICHR